MATRKKYHNSHGALQREKQKDVGRSFIPRSDIFVISISKKLDEVDWKNKVIPLFKPGDKIDDKYVVANEFTEDKNKGGEFGNIYFTEPYQGIFFAVKQPKKEILRQPGMPAMIFREADHWNDLGLHPNVAYCYFVKLIDDVPYIFIEYVSGGTLRDWITDGRCKDIQTSLNIAIQVCHGMEHAHKKNLLHRDLKPENILMSEEGVTKITDFGLSGPQDSKRSKMGTYNYMAPELFTPQKKETGKGEKGFESDIFSFGICMWEMFCNKRPFVVRFEDVRCEKYLGHSPENKNPKDFNPEIPNQLEAVLKKSVKKNKENRYKSFSALREALNNIYKELYNNDSPFNKIDIPDSLANDLNNRGYSFYQLGEEPKAREFWEEALKADPKHLEATFNLESPLKRGFYNKT